MLQIYLTETRSLVRNMTSNQPTFQLSGMHTTLPVTLLVYAWNKKGRSEVVTAREGVIITADTRSQSTELPPSVVMKEPLLFVIGGAVLGFLLITLLSLVWYFKRRVSEHKLQWSGSHPTHYTRLLNIRPLSDRTLNTCTVSLNTKHTKQSFHVSQSDSLV